MEKYKKEKTLVKKKKINENMIFGAMSRWQEVTLSPCLLLQKASRFKMAVRY